MEVVYASDEGYAGLMGVSIASLVKQSTAPKSLTVNVISDGIEEQSIRRLRSTVEEGGAKFNHVDMPDLDSLAGVKLELPDFTMATYARLWLPQIFPDTQRAIYIDCDTIILGSLDYLWGLELSATESVAGVLDATSSTNKAKVGLASHQHYVNAGVLLLDLEKWRSEAVIERFVAMLQASSGRVAHNDQGVINACLADSIRPVHTRYNLMSYAQAMSFDEIQTYKRPANWIERAELHEARQSPVILHATGSFLFDRPWVEGSKSPMAQAWRDAAEHTAWHSTYPTPATRSALVTRFVRLLCRTRLRTAILFALGLVQANFRDRIRAF